MPGFVQFSDFWWGERGMEDEPPFLKAIMRYAGIIEDKGTSFLTPRGLNTKKNVTLTGG